MPEAELLVDLRVAEQAMEFVVQLFLLARQPVENLANLLDLPVGASVMTEAVGRLQPIRYQLQHPVPDDGIDFLRPGQLYV